MQFRVSISDNCGVALGKALIILTHGAVFLSGDLKDSLLDTARPLNKSI